ncbi:hypothetical protein N7504_007430 [Penicillium tannophilum]|nr:hypothetical protein N7504_007430 [Penicillium tannophilum]
MFKSLCSDDTYQIRTAEQGKQEVVILQRALAEYDEALGPDHTSTLDTVNSIGILYFDQGKLREAEEILQRALAGYQKVLVLDHTSTLNTVNSIGILYSEKGKLKEAEGMYQRALTRYEKALGSDHEHSMRLAKMLNALSIVAGN